MNGKLIYEYELNDRNKYETKINCDGSLLLKLYFETNAVNSRIHKKLPYQSVFLCRCRILWTKMVITYKNGWLKSKKML